MIRKFSRTGLFIFLIWLLFFSCRKDEIITTDPSATLVLSTDTVWFDTVISQSNGGIIQPLSVTKRLWVFNPSANAVKVNISLKGNPYGIYKLNIDGQPSSSVNGKVIRGKDSIIIFVQIYVNQNDSTKPFFVFDAIDFNTNGNHQSVTLAGYARNAVYLRNQVLNCSSGNMHWTSTLPYVIYDSILVPFGCSLTIDAGTHVYSHIKSCLLVSGSIIVNGTTSNPVIFEGDRLEPDYSDIAGQWSGIRLLLNSSDNVIKNAVIKNGFIGVQVDSFSNNQNPKLLISHCVVKNMLGCGILGYSADMVAIDNLVFNCGQFGFLGAYGGNYFLYHNTFDGTGTTFNRSTPLFVLDNSPLTDALGNTIASFPLNADTKNNIINGSLEDEILLNSAQGGDTTGKVVIQYSIIKTQKYKTDLNINQNIINQDPQFKDQVKSDYTLKPGSPAKGKGIYVNVNDDIAGNARSNSAPSIGCYE